MYSSLLNFSKSLALTVNIYFQVYPSESKNGDCEVEDGSTVDAELPALSKHL